MKTSNSFPLTQEHLFKLCPCIIEVDGITFPLVEYGCQWYQTKNANLEDLAEQIKIQHMLVKQKAK